MHLETVIVWTNKISGCKTCIIKCTCSLLKTYFGLITITNVSGKIKNTKKY